jgi:aspartyl-tRNA(Asn)/glutamyl-tRNA(Gln) amidotransferase subunit A
VAVVATLRAFGAEIIEVVLLSLRVTQAAGSVLAFAKGSARFRELVRRDAPFAGDIRSLHEVGLAVPVADFVHAGRVRAAIRRVYAELFGRVDAILLPTSPIAELPRDRRG